MTTGGALDLRTESERTLARVGWRSRLGAWFTGRLTPVKRSLTAHEDRWLLVLALVSWGGFGALGASLPLDLGMWGNMLAEFWGAGVAGAIFWRILAKREPAVQEQVWLRERGSELGPWLGRLTFFCRAIVMAAFVEFRRTILALHGGVSSDGREARLDDWFGELQRWDKATPVDETIRLANVGIAVFNELRVELNQWNPETGGPIASWVQVPADLTGDSIMHLGAIVEDDLELGNVWLGRLSGLAGPVHALRLELQVLRSSRNALVKKRERGDASWIVDRWRIALTTGAAGAKALRLLRALSEVRAQAEP